MTTQIITRADARAQGLTRYFTGKPCPMGHIADRYVSTFGCVTCTRIRSDARDAAKSAAFRSREQPAHVVARLAARANGLKLYSPGVECQRGHVGERYVSTNQCTECLRIWKRDWRAANPDKVIEEGRRHRLANPEKVKAGYKKWQSTANGRAVKARLQRERRARLRNAEGKHNAKDLANILKAQRNRCAYCRNDISLEYEADHIIPLSKGGSNARRNIQLLCPTCNRQKQAQDPIRFAQRRGMLL